MVGDPWPVRHRWDPALVGCVMPCSLSFGLQGGPKDTTIPSISTAQSLEPFPEKPTFQSFNHRDCFPLNFFQETCVTP